LKDILTEEYWDAFRPSTDDINSSEINITAIGTSNTEKAENNNQNRRLRRNRRINKHGAVNIYIYEATQNVVSKLIEKKDPSVEAGPKFKKLVKACTNLQGFNTMLPTYQWSKENLYAYGKIRNLPLWDRWETTWSTKKILF